MPNIGSLTGLPQVLINIRRQHLQMAAGTGRGLRIAGLRLQRASQQLVPVEYGPLRASAYTRATGEGFSSVVTVGYTASYALNVHENVAMAGRGRPRPSGLGNYWDPAGRGQAKFLEQPARTMIPELRLIILRAAKIV